MAHYNIPLRQWFSKSGLAHLKYMNWTQRAKLFLHIPSQIFAVHCYSILKQTLYAVVTLKDEIKILNDVTAQKKFENHCITVSHSHKKNQ